MRLQKSNGEAARKQLDSYNSDLDTLKDFITTTQVSVLCEHARRIMMLAEVSKLEHGLQVNQARIYNHDVVARRANKSSTS